MNRKKTDNLDFLLD